jgi:hypothetical protein
MDEGGESLTVALRDEKEPMVFWAKRQWSALGGEQLGEWQLYVEGRERSYGTCAGRRDGMAICVGRGTACVGKGTA